MTKIEFELWGLTLLEPMALILNWLLSVVSLYLFAKLKSDTENKAIFYWRGFFLLFGISTFFGGLSHLFFNYWGLWGKLPNWLTAVVAVASLELAMTTYFRVKFQKGLTWIVYGKAALVYFIFLFDFSFDWVIVHTTIGFFLFLGIPSITLLAQGRQPYRFLALAFLFMLLTLPIKLGGLDIHLWFNRDDFSHLLMLFTLLSFYRGAKEMLSDQEVTEVETVLSRTSED